MKHLFITILLLLPLCRMLAQEREYVIVVHGGAGAMENLEDDKEKSTLYYAALDSALSIGNAILSAGGEGPEAVMAVVNYFENNPLFNAGKGATCTSAGTFELDASIMEGKDLTAGAVAGLKTVKNPINAAYAVKTKTPHVMLRRWSSSPTSLPAGGRLWTAHAPCRIFSLPPSLWASALAGLTNWGRPATTPTCVLSSPASASPKITVCTAVPPWAMPLRTLP